MRSGDLILIDSQKEPRLNGSWTKSAHPGQAPRRHPLWYQRWRLTHETRLFDVLGRFRPAPLDQTCPLFLFLAVDALSDTIPFCRLTAAVLSRVLEWPVRLP